MKSELKAKLLQHFSKKNSNGGFTLIELLVVIIIIGILSAIALPSFLNQANKAKQSEAKTYVGSMNRAQQAYYLENDTFAGNDQFAGLGLGIPATTKNYAYTITGPTTAAPVGVTNNAAPIQAASASIKSYIGGVQVSKITSGTGTSAVNEATTLAVLCEAVASRAADSSAATGAETVTYVTDASPTCATGYNAVK